MTSMLSAAASGLKYYQKVMDVAGENLANANVPTYRRIRVVAEGRPTPVGTGLTRNGVGSFTIDRLFDAGKVSLFDDPLAFAINDDAFIRVTSPDGTLMLTRLGKLTIDGSGLLMIAGQTLEPPVSVPDGLSHPEVAYDGVVSALNPDLERVPIGQITMAKLGNVEALEPVGAGFYTLGEGVGTVVEGTPGDGLFLPVIVSGLESSNVDPTTQFTTMMQAQRAYSSSTRTFRVGDDMLALAADLTQ